MREITEALLQVDLQELLKLKPAQIKKMTFTDEQARGLVRTYYRLQDMRVATFNQERAFSDEEKPHLLVDFFAKEMKKLEKMCSDALDGYSSSKPIGQWVRSIHGLDGAGTLASGLIANIDITKCPVVSHLWRYAGLDPTIEWLGKDKAREVFNEMVPKGKASREQLIEMAIKLNRNPELFVPFMTEVKKWKENPEDPKKHKIMEIKEASREDQISQLAMRPWNADLKKLCYKIGDSFLKGHNSPKDFYGKIYEVRKVYELAKNEKGDYAAEAAKKLKKCKITDPTTRKIYESGKLTPGHIESRVKRYATKIFLSHYHAVAYEMHYGVKPPKPFAIAILGHAHEVPIPNWPMA